MVKNKLNNRGWQVPKNKIIEFFPKRTKYCVGIPVFNEGERIQLQLQEMKHFSKLADIIIFDGGSTDGATNPKFLKKIGVRSLLVNISNNLGGQATQLRMGLAYALKQGYEGIITIDGNHKDDVSALPKFIEALDEGYDYAQSSRFIQGGKHKNTPQDRILFNRYLISPILSLAARKWYSDTPNAFRAYSRKYLLHPEVKPFRNIFERYEMLWYLTIRCNQLGLKSKEIPVTRSYPKNHIPTKIVGWKKILDLINILKISLGLYHPK